jgi:hypothetical protein
VYVHEGDKQVDDLQYVVMNRIRADANDPLAMLTDPWMPFDLFSDREFEAGMLAMIAGEIARIAPVTTEAKDFRAPDRYDRLIPGPFVRNPARRDPNDAEIDKVLRDIAKSRPRDHKAVFYLLDGRVPISDAQPFKKVGTWLAGFHANPHLAHVWLSKRWRQLNLPAFRP